MLTLRQNREPPAEPRPDAAPRRDAGEEARRRRVVRCAACRSIITRVEARIEVEGAHAHSFVNPSGVAFRVRCFGEAPGCVEVGETSTFWSWFRGYAWRVALCAACGAHVGWSFAGESSAFYGLIADRIDEASE